MLFINDPALLLIEVARPRHYLFELTDLTYLQVSLEQPHRPE